MTSSFVIDTNVLIIANGRHTFDDEDCQRVSKDTLESAKQSIVTIDDNDEIILEYRKHCNFSGQPGVGDEFFRWLFYNKANPKFVEVVPITPVNGTYKEFPNSPKLQNFDYDDRKFVCVALKSKYEATVYNATDTRSWPVYDAVLIELGLNIENLCPKYIKKYKLI